jgi:hypothetical protein
VRCATIPAHWIGAEYLSRASRGDPGSTVPFTAVSHGDEWYAMLLLDKNVFADSAWKFNPEVLRTLTYTEHSAFTDGAWVYNPTPRHDISVAQTAAAVQEAVLSEMFSPLRLQRIDELGYKYAPGTTMTLGDLFVWTRDGIFGDVRTGAVAKAGTIRRNLQTSFAKRLADMWVSPAPGTPPDAQALARLQLGYLQHDASAAMAGAKDDQTRAHLQALVTIASQALNAHRNIAAPGAAGPGGGR